MSFISTLSILEKLKAALVAMELQPGEPLFQKVEFYSTPNLVQALEDLRIFKSRAAIVVPSGDEFTSNIEGGQLQTDAVYEFELLMTDRDYGKRQSASTSDSDTPGVVKIKDMIITRLLGENLGFEPRRLNLRPVSGQALVLTKADRETANGREAWQMTWQCDAGTEVA